PSLGLAWIASKEDFLAQSDVVNFLKLKLSGGILNSDLPIDGFYYYDNRYSTSGSMGWNEGSRSSAGVVSNWAENRNLGFAKRKILNVGVVSSFFDNMIGFETNVFYDVYSDMIVRPSTRYGSFYSDFIPYE